MLDNGTRPQGRDEKKARAGTTPPTMENEAWRDHFGSVHGGPVLRQRKNKKMTKEDKLTGRQTGRGGGWGKGELRGGDVPSRRVSPCTLLSYEGGFHSRWPQRRGEEGEVLFFFFSPHPPFEQVPLYGEATLKSWGAVLLYALVCGMTNQPIKKRVVGRGGWQVHLYGEAARCVP